MLIGDHSVEFVGDAFSVAQPCCAYMGGESVGQFGGAGGAEILPELGPGFQPRRQDVPIQLRPEILCRFAVARNHIIRAGFRRVVDGLEALDQFREDRNHANAAVLVMLGLARPHDEAVVANIHIAPGERQGFGGNPQATVAGQRQQQLPLRIGAHVDHFLDILGRHEYAPGWIPLHNAGKMAERIFVNELSSSGHLKEVPAVADSFSDCRLGESIGDQVGAKGVRIDWLNIAEHDSIPFAEKGKQAIAGLLEDDQRGGFEVVALSNVFVEKCGQRDRGVLFSRLHQPRFRQSRVENVADFSEPLGGAPRRSLSGDRGGHEVFDMAEHLDGFLLREVAKSHRLSYAVGRDEEDAFMPVGFIPDGCHFNASS